MTKLIAAIGLGFMLAASLISASAAQAANNLVLEVSSGGQVRKVVIRLRPDLAPQHVARVEKLAQEKFYDGIVFHRVLRNFMAQSGDPTGTGTGGSKYPDLPAEFTQAPFKRGTIGAARTANPNSANSQFFICFTNTGCSHLSGQYTVWGQVVSGMEAIDTLRTGDPNRGGMVPRPDKIVRAYIEPATN
ncbi:MAG: peptidylprolyl isomerase [Pseudomonadota bacterium]